VLIFQVEVFWVVSYSSTTLCDTTQKTSTWNTDVKLQGYSEMNLIIKRNVGTQMSIQKKLRSHNIISKETFSYSGDTWVLKQKEIKGRIWGKTSKDRIFEGVSKSLHNWPLTDCIKVNHRRNSDVTESLKFKSAVEEIQGPYQKGKGKSFGNKGNRRAPIIGIHLPIRRDDRTWDDQNDDGQNKTVLVFIGTCLEDLTLQSLW
jgi:hypothetical protein